MEHTVGDAETFFFLFLLKNINGKHLKQKVKAFCLVFRELSLQLRIVGLTMNIVRSDYKEQT
jgi:hypothetical protein